MPLTRRHTLGLTAAALAGAIIPSRLTAAPNKIDTVLFDAFTVFDPRPIFANLETIVPGRAKELADLWRTRQFEYTWLRVVAGEYQDFWKTTRDALVYAADALDISISPRKVVEIMQGYLELKAWPDAEAALETLKSQELTLAFLSNFTPRMLNAAIDSAGLGGTFAKALSTDVVQTFKPDPRAYRLAIEVLHTPRDQILFAPFAGWDAAGGKWFGYETFWVNRLGTPPEVLGPETDGMGRNLDDLVAYLRLRA
jgi:2-haloacid dehalogenase